MNKNTVLPPSLQSEINKNSNILSHRDELRQKLHNKMNQNKQINNRPSERMKQKLEKDAKKEKREVDNDPRVTHNMKHYFIKALKTYEGLDLANPVEILNNPDKYKLDYYNFSIELLKNNNGDSNVLNNPYCDYMKEVLGLS
jgi:hypothetical protein